MIFNSSIPISLDRFHKPHFLFYRQLLWTAGGLVLFAVATQFPLRLLKKRGIIITIILFTYGLLAATFTQTPINGTYRWIHAGGFSFQPSELAKLVTIIFLAWYFSRYPDLKDHPWRHLFRIVLVIAPMMALIIKEPDLGNALMIFGITVILLFFAGLPIKHMLFMGSVSVAVIIAAVLMSPYMMQRLITFLDPSADPLGKGYQINQSLIAVGHSGFWGLGLGQSTQKLFFLPEPHTDFIYAVVAERERFHLAPVFSGRRNLYSSGGILRVLGYGGERHASFAAIKESLYGKKEPSAADLEMAETLGLDLYITVWNRDSDACPWMERRFSENPSFFSKVFSNEKVRLYKMRRGSHQGVKE